MNKTELRSATSAANKIIKLTPAARKDYAGCFYDKQGRQIIVSNCIAIRLNEHLSVAEAKIPFSNVDNLFLPACENTKELDLLSLKDLKDYIHNAKECKYRGHKSIVYDFGENLPMVNPEYMLLIYKVLGQQNLTAKVNKYKRETRPIYFSSDRGEGLLMPVRKGV